MPHFKLPAHHHGFHFVGKRQKAQEVGGRRTRTADRLGGVFVGEGKLFDEALDALSLFDGVQIFALDVLDERDGKRVLVVDGADDDRDPFESGQARRAGAALARDDFIARSAHGAHENRAQHALFPDRVGQLRKRRVVHMGSGLILPRHEARKLDLFDAVRVLRTNQILAERVPEKRVKPAPEPLRLFFDHCGHAFLPGSVIDPSWVPCVRATRRQTPCRLSPPCSNDRRSRRADRNSAPRPDARCGE